MKKFCRGNLKCEGVSLPATTLNLFSSPGSPWSALSFLWWLESWVRAWFSLSCWLSPRGHLDPRLMNPQECPVTSIHIPLAVVPEEESEGKGKWDQWLIWIRNTSYLEGSGSHLLGPVDSLHVTNNLGCMLCPIGRDSTAPNMPWASIPPVAQDLHEIKMLFSLSLSCCEVQRAQWLNLPGSLPWTRAFWPNLDRAHCRSILLSWPPGPSFLLEPDAWVSPFLCDPSQHSQKIVLKTIAQGEDMTPWWGLHMWEGETKLTRMLHSGKILGGWGRIQRIGLMEWIICLLCAEKCVTRMRPHE